MSEAGVPGDMHAALLAFDTVLSFHSCYAASRRTTAEHGHSGYRVRDECFARRFRCPTDHQLTTASYVCHNAVQAKHTLSAIRPALICGNPDVSQEPLLGTSQDHLGSYWYQRRRHTMTCSSLVHESSPNTAENVPSLIADGVYNRESGVDKQTVLLPQQTGPMRGVLMDALVFERKACQASATAAILAC